MEDDQALEIEALKAIYMDDFEELEENPKTFQIRLLPNPGQENNHVGLVLHVVYTREYPNELPEFKVKKTHGITGEQLTIIEEKLTQQATESVGTPMVYNLAQICKEWLDDNNIDQEEIDRQRKLKELEIKEKKRAEGTPVTPETFAKWREKFYADLEADGKQEEKSEKKKKLSGRQLFEKYTDLVTSDTQFIEEGEEEVSVDWSVFNKELENLDEGDDENDE